MTEQFLKPNLNPSKKLEQKLTKEGVGFVFEHNPELAKIGTKEQYSEYLDSIFPKSKVKKILWHGGEDKWNINISRNKYLYLTDSLKTASRYSRASQIEIEEIKRGGLFDTDEDYDNFGKSIIPIVYPFIIDVQKYKKTYEIETLPVGDQNVSINDDFGNTEHTEYVVNSHNTKYHILGLSEDIDGFKDFVSKEK